MGTSVTFGVRRRFLAGSAPWVRPFLPPMLLLLLSADSSSRWWLATRAAARTAAARRGRSGSGGGELGALVSEDSDDSLVVSVMRTGGPCSTNAGSSMHVAVQHVATSVAWALRKSSYASSIVAVALWRGACAQKAGAMVVCAAVACAHKRSREAGARRVATSLLALLTAPLAVPLWALTLGVLLCAHLAALLVFRRAADAHGLWGESESGGYTETGAAAPLVVHALPSDEELASVLGADPRRRPGRHAPRPVAVAAAAARWRDAVRTMHRDAAAARDDEWLVAPAVRHVVGRVSSRPRLFRPTTGGGTHTDRGLE